MRLSLGSGPRPRLLAPGQPDWIGADGERVAWVIRDVFFLLDGDGVEVVPVGDLVDDVVGSRGRWTLASGDAAVYVRGFTATGAVVFDEIDPLEVRPGVDCALGVAAPRHVLCGIEGGSDIALPDAATRARLAAPFATGEGLVWIDLEVVYRMAAGRQPGAVGRAPGAEALAVGPGGAALVQLADDTLVVPTRALAARLGDKLDVATARFSPDGEQALVGDDDGVVLLGLREGKVLRRWDGDLVPVGFAPGPVMLDRAEGRLLGADGEVWLERLGSAVPALAGDLLVGPGATGWDLSTGERRDIGSHQDIDGNVLATDGKRVVVVDQARVRVGELSFEHGLCPGDDDFVERVSLRGGDVVLQTVTGEAAAFGAAGAAKWRRHDPEAVPEVVHHAEGVVPGDPAEPSEFTVDGVRHALPADGFARRGDRVYAFCDEGMLVEI